MIYGWKRMKRLMKTNENTYEKNENNYENTNENT